MIKDHFLKTTYIQTKPHVSLVNGCQDMLVLNKELDRLLFDLASK